MPLGKIKCCPFCAGPAVPFICDQDTREPIDIIGDYPESGLNAEAHVFCHNCGAQGPTIDGFELGKIYNTADAEKMLSAAVELWQQRS